MGVNVNVNVNVKAEADLKGMKISQVDRYEYELNSFVRSYN